MGAWTGLRAEPPMRVEMVVQIDSTTKVTGSIGGWIIAATESMVVSTTAVIVQTAVSITRVIESIIEWIIVATGPIAAMISVDSGPIAVARSSIAKD